MRIGQDESLRSVEEAEREQVQVAHSISSCPVSPILMGSWPAGEPVCSGPRWGREGGLLYNRYSGDSVIEEVPLVSKKHLSVSS